MSRDTKLLALGAAVMIAAAVVAIVMLHVAPARPSSHARADVAASSQAAEAPTALGLPRVAAYSDRAESGLSTDDPLTAYRRANVYPPTSHPLTRDHDDLLHPNRRHETERPTDDDADTKFLFTADRYFVLGDGTLAATLDVHKLGAPVPVQIVAAYAVVHDATKPDGVGQQVPIAFAGAGGAWSAVFAPSTFAQLSRQTTIGMYVEFATPSAHQHAHFDFQYTPASGIPARFTGAFHDELVDGSLVVHAGVDVTRAGRYLIDCNLYDDNNEPVAWARFRGELVEGQATADLSFFGKVFTDANASGPFHIGELRGARFDPGVEPDLEQMPSFTGTYATEPYPATAFSSAEYDSAQKQQMIQLLSQEQARGVHLGAAGGH
jgi:hypothetical protein